MKFLKENIELFKQLFEIEINGVWYDLHNDFVLKNLIEYEKKIKLRFINEDRNETIEIIFSNVIIDKSNLKNEENLTIDNFHRCRYLHEGKLFDVFENRMAFMLEFLPNILIELRCESITIEFIES